MFSLPSTQLSWQKTPTSLWSCALYQASGLAGVSHRSRASCKTRCSSWASPLGDAGLWAWRASRNRCSRALGMSPTRPREGWNSNRWTFSEVGLEEKKKWHFFTTKDKAIFLGKISDFLSLKSDNTAPIDPGPSKDWGTNWPDNAACSLFYHGPWKVERNWPMFLSSFQTLMSKGKF